MKTCSFLAALVLMLTAILSIPFASRAETTDISTLYKTKDTDAAWSAGNGTSINLNTVTEPALTLTQAGDYVLSGSYKGQIVIEASEDAMVHLILNGADISSTTGPAIYEKKADKLIVTLADGSHNTLTGGTAVADGDDTIGAALYAEDDLSINGTGALTAAGTAKHGIQSKADLIIAGGSISVTAVTDGIRGRNSILVLDGDIHVTAGGDGLTTTRTDKDGKGWIILAGGKLDVTTGSGAGTVRASANSKGGRRGMTQTKSSSSDVSQKAVKAATDLTVLGGSYTFNTADDGLHAVNVTVNSGEFIIKSGDDGMHADQEMTVNGGIIRIDQCYEGLEGVNVTVNGGDIRIVASDDGVNASDGKDMSGYGGRGGDRFGGNSGMLTITGGQVEVTAGGDGLDSNGSLAISGGIVGIWAATTQGEGAIDFNGTGTLSGGTVILASNGGFMTSGLSGASFISVPMNGSGAAGSEITVTTANGTATFTPQNSFSSVAAAGSGITQGQPLTVSISGKQVFSGTVTADMDAGTTGFGAGSGRGFGKGHGGKGRGNFPWGNRDGMNGTPADSDRDAADSVTSPTGNGDTNSTAPDTDNGNPSGFGKGNRRGR